jgi:predicted O-methyltransferase YrrM
MEEALNTLMNRMRQHTADAHSGGLHTPPELRLLLLCLARMQGAELIIETGYDAGYTTRALALSGARVVAVDNLSEYPNIDGAARAMLSGYSNVELLQADAGELLRAQADGSVDLIFVDDDHRPDHVRVEAKEVRRILRPGGIAVFHDTNIADLWVVVEKAFDDWDKMRFSAPSPENSVDYGFGVVRKP